MKKIFPDTPDVSQGVANRGVRIIERHLRLHKVDRAKDLPEEAKIRLLRDLQAFFDAESREGPKQGTRERGFWSKLWEKIQNFLSFSETNPGTPSVFCTFGGDAMCGGMPNPDG
jgi:hypothetical protein